MRAAAGFREAGFDVRQSDAYADPETGKGREIDLVALDSDLVGITEIFFIAECKSSDKPWVVLTSENAYENYNRLHSFAVVSKPVLEYLANNFMQLQHIKPHLAGRSSHGGYGFRQVFAKDSDPAFAAATNVMKACKELARRGEHPERERLKVVFPVIVVDSPLFECHLGIDGELHIKEVAQSEFLYFGHIPDPVGCRIAVVTIGELKAFAVKAKAVASDVRAELQPEDERLLRAWDF
jgi:hypothetical protein